MTDLSISELQDIANILRRDTLVSTTAAGSGHPTSCMSIAEIISALFFHQMHYDPQAVLHPNNDEFVLSKGHAAPILYAALKRAGCIKNNLNTLRKITSPLEGHPMPRSLPWIKVATGSLGQGLSVAAGMALAAKLSHRHYKTYVLLGDGELAEGSNYEAAQFIAKNNLNNLVAIADINRLGQTGPTALDHDLKQYAKRFEAFGWDAFIIDGHSMKQVVKYLKKASRSAKPAIIIAKTFKGYGVSFLKDSINWHGKVLDDKTLKLALEQIPSPSMPYVRIQHPHMVFPHKSPAKRPTLPKYKLKDDIATRQAYGETLAQLTKTYPNIVAVDADVANSTFTRLVREATPHQFIQSYIAEQNMVGVALGLSKKGFIPFATSFASFLSRAHDQFRMAALSNANMVIVGSHAGVSIGPDGASQMGLEDISMFRSLPGSTVFYPSDATSTAKLTALAAGTQGLTYIRLSRPTSPVIYKSSEKFPANNFKVLKESRKDKLTIIAAGITLHEALKAQKLLKKKKIDVAVVDLYCIKPLPEKQLIEFIQKHGNKVIVVEDHYPEGGIGEAIAKAIAKAIANTNITLTHLAVNEIPHSGETEELLHNYNIDAEAIVGAV